MYLATRSAPPLTAGAGRVWTMQVHRKFMNQCSSPGLEVGTYTELMLWYEYLQADGPGVSIVNAPYKVRGVGACSEAAVTASVTDSRSESRCVLCVCTSPV